jgi:hypothetical protein
LIQDAIDALDEPKRTFILLHYRDGMSQSEIARRTEPMATQALVQWHISSGLKKIVNVIKARVEEMEYNYFLKELAKLNCSPDPECKTPSLDTLHEWYVDEKKKYKASS